jgi:galactose mutarotase-like enzyme
MSVQDFAHGVVELATEGASADVSLRGAEPVSWKVNGHELLWSGNALHWGWHAPILFPVVGESAGGLVRVDAKPYPMPRHGFARTAAFECVARSGTQARFRLTDSAATHAHYPFAFLFDVVITLERASLSLVFEIENRDLRDLPYSVGFHPALLWPFAGGVKSDYSIEFEHAENPLIPTITSAGLLCDAGRRLALQGRTLRLDPSLFSDDALVFRHAASRSLRFVGPAGTLVMAVEDMPHLALWTKPDAPFLCIEPWTGYADMQGFSGELRDRTSIRRLKRGDRARHAVVMSWQAG